MWGHNSTQLEQHMEETMKKLSAVLLMALLLVGCGSDAKETKGSGESAKDKDGNYASAEITMKGDKVVSISLDETKGDKSKKELGADYNMKSVSDIGEEWDEQVKFLENYIKKHGIDKVEVKSDGSAKNEDVLAGCTISITPLMEAVNNAKDNAK